MLAFFGNLSGGELLLVLVIAILIFGRRLPQVAAQGAHQVLKLRRSLQEMWRETGLAEEWRNLQREVDGVRRLDPLSRDPLRGDPPPRRAPKALPDQQSAVEAAEAAERAARQAPELPWATPEQGPVAEEARREGAELEDAAAEGAGPQPERRSSGATEASSREAHPARAEPDPGPADEPDSGAPEGSVPRS